MVDDSQEPPGTSSSTTGRWVTIVQSALLAVALALSGYVAVHALRPRPVPGPEAETPPAGGAAGLGQAEPPAGGGAAGGGRRGLRLRERWHVQGVGGGVLARRAAADGEAA